MLDCCSRCKIIFKNTEKYYEKLFNFSICYDVYYTRKLDYICTNLTGEMKEIKLIVIFLYFHIKEIGNGRKYFLICMYDY